jgi:hypothetical protein
VNLESDAETDLSPRFANTAAGTGESEERAVMRTPAWPAVAAAALALLLIEWLAWVWRPGRTITA